MSGELEGVVQQDIHVISVAQISIIISYTSNTV